MNDVHGCIGPMHNTTDFGCKYGAKPIINICFISVLKNSIDTQKYLDEQETYR